MFLKGDALRLPFRDQSVDLVFGSPPYMDARTYGIGFKLKCQAWIDWMLDVTTEAMRVSRGLVLWVVAGVTRKRCYQPGPEGLLYLWWKRGGECHCLRPVYWNAPARIPGSGGDQWLRADVEYVLAFKRPGKLPWADNTANGQIPKWAPGGEMSHRDAGGVRKTSRRCTRGRSGGDTIQETKYLPPDLANPGNLVTINVGGGALGHELAHKNEAPFPQALAEWFIRSWCPPEGTVLDVFSGSGSTVAAARNLMRRGIGLDIRDSQCLLGMQRNDGWLFP